MSRAKLSVNIDHIATLRQARHESEPDPVAAARTAFCFPTASKPPSVVSSCLRSGTKVASSGFRRQAMRSIAGVAAISRLNFPRTVWRKRCTSWSCT